MGHPIVIWEAPSIPSEKYRGIICLYLGHNLLVDSF